ncbi:MAG: cupin domain-containing protein [Pseudomonadota bacterium]
MAETLAVEVASLFQEKADLKNRVIFPGADAVDIKFHDLPEGGVQAKLLLPVDFETKVEPYLIEIPLGRNLPSHFFVHKGEELGYLLSGRLQLKLEKAVYNVRAGDVIYLSSEMPSQWINPGPGSARLLWLKIK